MGRLVVLGLLLASALLVALLFPEIERRLPPNSLPWRPVALDKPPNWLAHWQIYKLKSDGNLCRDALRRARIAFTPLADRQRDGACGYTNVVRLDDPPVPLPRRP